MGQYFFRIVNNWLFLAVLVACQAILLYAQTVFSLSHLYSNIFIVLVTLLLLALKPLQGLKTILVLLPLSVPIFMGNEAGLAAWRLWVIALGGRYAAEVVRELGSQAFTKENFKQRFLGMYSGFEVYFLLFILLSLLTTLWTTYPSESLKFSAFLLNAYILYVVARGVVKTKVQADALLTSALWSVGAVVFTGLVQLVLSLSHEFYYFWQGWSILISPQFVGNSLAQVLGYSNSWIISSSFGAELRLFGLLTDSHAFGVLCIYMLGLLLILRESLFEQRKALWVGLILATAACMTLSGTRGVWVGVLAPVFVFAFLRFKHRAQTSAGVIRRVFLVTLVSFLLIVSSSGIYWVLGQVRNFGKVDTGRALSVFNLKEASNSGRLRMWGNAGSIFLARPWGLGAGNFIVAATGEIVAGESYESLAGQRNELYNLPEEYVTAHSLYLHILVETGAAGFLLFSAFIFFLLRFLYSHYQKTGGVPSTYTLPWLMVCLWLFAYSTFDVTFYNERVLMLFFLLSGAVLAGVDKNFKLQA